MNKQAGNKRDKMKAKCKSCGKMRDCTKWFGEYVCYACYNDKQGRD